MKKLSPGSREPRGPKDWIILFIVLTAGIFILYFQNGRLYPTQRAVFLDSRNLEEILEVLEPGDGIKKVSTDLILRRWEKIPNPSVIIEHLLNTGVDVNKPDRSGYSLLMYACGLGEGKYLAREKFFQIFLEAGADIHYKAPDGLTALDVAARYGLKEQFETLLAAGAEVTTRTLSEAFPNEDNRYDYERYWIAKTALEHLIPTNQAYECPEIYQMALLGDSEQVISEIPLLTREELDDNVLPICIAAFCDNKAMEAFLEESGRIDDTNILGPMLFAASSYDNLPVVEFLYHNCVFKKNTVSRSLEEALMNGSTQVADYLMDEEVTLDVPNQRLSAEQVFFDVSWEGQIDSARVMLEHGFVLTHDRAYHAIERAGRNNQAEYTKFLISELGVDPNINCDIAESALCLAARNHNIDLIRWLAEQGARVDTKESPIACAVTNNGLETIRYLHEELGADINGISTSSEGRPIYAIEEVIYRGYFDILKYMVEHGARLDIKIILDYPDKVPSLEEFVSTRSNSKRIRDYLLAKIDEEDVS